MQGDVKTRNDQRLAWLQQAPQTRARVRGVLASDQTVVTQEGKLMEDVGWCWDHADQRHVSAHASVLAHYVCPAGAHCLLEWRRFQKRDSGVEGAFQDHTLLCLELSDDVITRALPGDWTGDRSVTSAKLLHHIQNKPRAYGGALKLHRQGVDGGREQKRQEGARPSPWAAKTPVRMGRTRSGSFSQQRRIPDVPPPVRVLRLWRERGDQEASTALGSHRGGWEVIRLSLGSRPRWTGTETLHRDGQQQLGLGDCQVRSGEGQTRHVYLVSVA